MNFLSIVQYTFYTNKESTKASPFSLESNFVKNEKNCFIQQERVVTFGLQLPAQVAYTHTHT